MPDTQIVLVCLSCSAPVDDIARLVLELDTEEVLSCSHCNKPRFVLYAEQRRRIPVTTVADLRKVIGQFTPLPGERWH